VTVTLVTPLNQIGVNCQFYFDVKSAKTECTLGLYVAVVGTPIS